MLQFFCGNVRTIVGDLGMLAITFGNGAVRRRELPPGREKGDLPGEYFLVLSLSA
jgi:hypothetical protein